MSTVGSLSTINMMILASDVMTCSPMILYAYNGFKSPYNDAYALHTSSGMFDQHLAPAASLLEMPTRFITALDLATYNHTYVIKSLKISTLI